MVVRFLFVLMVTLSACQGSETSNSNPTESSPNIRQVFTTAFNSPECTNPCWLGIEVGVTDKETAIVILEEHGIDFTLEGYSENSIWLHDIPDGLVPAMVPHEFAFGGIQSDGEKITHINFSLDLCVSTVVTAYGAPDIWHGILIYFDHQMFFGIDQETQRVDGIFLHMEEAMPPPDELEDWSEYVDVFSGDCTDVFTENDD